MNSNKAESVVLVVDDEAAIRHVARRMLETGGYRVIEAGDAPRPSRSSMPTRHSTC